VRRGSSTRRIAPESRAVVSLRESYGLFIGGEFTPGADGRAFKTISPATEEVLAEVTEAGPADVDRAVTAARKAYEHTWVRACRAKERAKYLFRIARIIQERARELAVLESLDNGKPIRESRDVDIPLAAAHFFYHAGWADKLATRASARRQNPLGVAGQVIPWNFPLLMLAWKIAPALACGNTVVLKPAETTPLTALTFAEICQQADLPPGVVNIVTGAGDTGRPGHPPRHRQGGVHRLHRGRQGNRPGLRAHAQEADPGTGRQGRQHRVRGRPGRPGRRGHRERHLLQPGPRVLRGLPAAGPGVRLRRGAGLAAAAAGTLRLGDPLDKNTDVGAINSAAQLAKIRELSAGRRGRGRAALVAAVRAAGQGLLVPADRVHRGVPGAPHRARGDLRAGAVRADVPDPGRGGGEGQQHAVRAVGRGLDRQGSRILWMASRLRAGVVWANTFNKFDPPRRSAATRNPATAGKAAGTGWRPTSMSDT
jgi:aldehyde dehydrogenase (NAD+)